MGLKQKIKYYAGIIKQNIFPYIYREEIFDDSDCIDGRLEDYSLDSSIPKKIFCFWTGFNEMSENRKSSIESLKKNSGVEVILVTPDNIDNYILKDYPLHKSFENLSLVHKSDYLRCYFMHHYGGAYSDIKKCKKNWEKAFRTLEKNKNFYLLGYREVSAKHVAKVGGKLQYILEKNVAVLLGNGAYIMRPYTQFTYSWYHELHKRLDFFEQKLEKNPGNIFGDNEGYPIPYTYILGNIFHPLCLKYNDKIIYNNSIRPIFSNYK